MLLEPVQGEGGVNPAIAEYFQGVRRLCDERGLLFMVDEVQTGLGRTGEWFGFEHFGVAPDVVTMAKALGNGVPIGACWARAEVAERVRARRPRHAPSAVSRSPRPRRGPCSPSMEEIDAAGVRPSGRCRPHRRACSPCPGSPTCGASGCCSAPSSTASTRGSSPPTASRRVSSSTPSRPTALRFAPSLLVTDDEIDEAVAILSTVLDAHAAARTERP